jgi:hypothetical protein
MCPQSRLPIFRAIISADSGIHESTINFNLLEVIVSGVRKVLSQGLSPLVIYA